MIRASADPPSNMIGTLGEYHMRSTRATKLPRRSKVLVRFEIQIGVDWTSVCAEPTRPAALFSCLTVFPL
jgi:hypothetical protein